METIKRSEVLVNNTASKQYEEPVIYAIKGKLFLENGSTLDMTWGIPKISEWFDPYELAGNFMRDWIKKVNNRWIKVEAYQITHGTIERNAYKETMRSPKISL